jgi:putative component of toxin-antitoxin plasmid stabilization module
VIELKQTETFAKWEGRLHDKRAKGLLRNKRVARDA